MKFNLVYLFLFLLIIGCKNENEITFEPITILGDRCAKCPQVTIAIPQALDQAKISSTINTGLNEEIILMLNFSEDETVNNIEKAIASFSNAYTTLNDKFPEESTPWQASIEGTKVFENEKIITLKLEAFLFTGGAHGYNLIKFLNFDKQKGQQLSTKDLFKDPNTFTDFAEKKFRAKEKIPINKNINETGFMFEKGLFYLPQNVGYTKTGIELAYEPYEIAPFSDGEIILNISYTEANIYLIYPVKL